MRETLPRLVRAALLVLPAATLWIVWWPEYAHWHTSAPTPGDSAVARALHLPADSVLDELAELSVLPFERRDSASVVQVAEGLLEGRLVLPDLPPTEIVPGFAEEDLVGVPGALRLWYAGWVVPDFLLAAYAATGRDDFFDAAERFLEGWEEFERGALVPTGLLWNDHAVAARVRVLAHFWRHARVRSEDPERTGRWVLSRAAELRELLADPEHFTFSTNHGMMQNLGLLQLEAGFPTLPGWPAYRDTALTRLDGQLAFLLDEGGFVRENSAGYQAWGLEMLGMTFRTMTLLGAPIPDDWRRRYRAGVRVLDALQRPDGSLPANGDTDGSAEPWFPRVVDLPPGGGSSPMRAREAGPPDQDLLVRPSAGYWIHWQGREAWPDSSRLAHTVVTWTTPPAFGHKHADEPSVLVWSHGVSWLTSVGYWPYGTVGRLQAEGWAGANAPHLVGEPARSARRPRLVAQGTGGEVAAVELERQGPGDFRVRRQVLALGAGRWLVVDRTRGARPPGTSTVWTLSPDVSVEAGGAPGEYLLQGGPVAGRMAIATSGRATQRAVRGSASPFAGWHVMRGRPVPAPAVVVRQADEDAHLVLLLEVGDAWSGGGLEVREMASADRWTLRFPGHPELSEIRREGEALTVVRAGDGGTATVRLREAPDPSGELERIARAYDEMAAAYPRFRSLHPTRVKVTWVLLALLLFQELVLFGVRRLLPGAILPVGAFGVACWILLAGWLHLSFLRPFESLARPEAAPASSTAALRPGSSTTPPDTA